MMIKKIILLVYFLIINCFGSERFECKRRPADIKNETFAITRDVYFHSIVKDEDNNFIVNVYSIVEGNIKLFISIPLILFLNKNKVVDRQKRIIYENCLYEFKGAFYKDLEDVLQSYKKSICVIEPSNLKLNSGESNSLEEQSEANIVIDEEQCNEPYLSIKQEQSEHLDCCLIS